MNTQPSSTPNRYNDECYSKVVYNIDFSREEMMIYIQKLNQKKYAIDKRFGVNRHYRLHNHK